MRLEPGAGAAKLQPELLIRPGPTPRHDPSRVLLLEQHPDGSATVMQSGKVCTFTPAQLQGYVRTTDGLLPPGVKPKRKPKAPAQPRQRRPEGRPLEALPPEALALAQRFREAPEPQRPKRRRGQRLQRLNEQTDALLQEIWSRQNQTTAA